MPPYTYSKLCRFVDTVGMCKGVRISSLGTSLGGIDLPLIQINSETEEIERKERRAVVILARTHPAETCSNFTLETMIDKILQSNKLR